MTLIRFCSRQNVVFQSICISMLSLFIWRCAPDNWNSDRRMTSWAGSEVYAQVISDLIFCNTNLLPLTIFNLKMEVSNLVAQHLLAGSLSCWWAISKAVDAATVVISDPSMALVTTGMGSHLLYSPSYDVYFDLFQPGNQNRKQANNKEALGNSDWSRTL